MPTSPFDANQQLLVPKERKLFWKPYSDVLELLQGDRKSIVATILLGLKQPDNVPHFCLALNTDDTIRQFIDESHQLLDFRSFIMQTNSPDEIALIGQVRRPFALV